MALVKKYLVFALKGLDQSKFSIYFV